MSANCSSSCHVLSAVRVHEPAGMRSAVGPSQLLKAAVPPTSNVHATANIQSKALSTASLPLASPTGLSSVTP